MHYPQPPAAPWHYPHAPGMPPPGPPPFYVPPAPPLGPPPPLPGMIHHGPAPYLHHHRNPSGSPWAPTPFIPPTFRAGLRGKRLPLYLGIAATVIAAGVLVAGLWTPGFFVTKQLDVSAVQAGVMHVLSDPNGYGAKDVSDVTCNDGHNPTIIKGDTFTCQATIDRIKHQFVVTFTDDAGSYEVSVPKGRTV